MSNEHNEETFTRHYRNVQRIKFLHSQSTGKIKSFSLVQKAIYFFLYSWVAVGKEAFPSLEEMADELAVSRKTIHSAIDELVDFGIVRRQYRGRNMSVLYHPVSPRDIIQMSKSIPANAVMLNHKEEAPAENKPPVLLRIKESLLAHIDKVLYVLYQMGHKEFKPDTPDIQQPKEDDNYLVNVKRSSIEEYDKDGW